jgi:hypothetical protein
LADGAQRGLATLPDVANQTSPQSPVWPEADIDALSATDFEDLVVFAADVFEFVQQEYALLVAAYGESRSALLGAAAL